MWTGPVVTRWQYVWVWKGRRSQDWGDVRHQTISHQGVLENWLTEVYFVWIKGLFHGRPALIINSPDHHRKSPICYLCRHQCLAKVIFWRERSTDAALNRLRHLQTQWRPAYFHQVWYSGSKSGWLAYVSGITIPCAGQVYSETEANERASVYENE